MRAGSRGDAHKMKIDTQDNGDVLVLGLEGELVSEACETLREFVSSILRQTRSALVLDMSQVGFIDSKGLEILLWIRDYCRLSVIQFRLAGLSESCHTILEITRLKQELVCYGELNEAVKSLA